MEQYAEMWGELEGHGEEIENLWQGFPEAPLRDSTTCFEMDEVVNVGKLREYAHLGTDRRAEELNAYIQRCETYVRGVEN